jgi:hypothetical protein
LLGDAGNFFAFVQADDKGLSYERRPVVVGMKDDRFAEIIEGIFPGDKVVTLGNYQLQYVIPKAPAAADHDKVGAVHETGAASSTSWIKRIAFWVGAAVVVFLLLKIVAKTFRRTREPSPVLSPRRPVASDAVIK